MNTSGRNKFPRIFELHDLLPNPLPEAIAFPSLDEASIRLPQKRKFLQDVEAELQGLDPSAWATLKAKLTPMPKKRKARLEPLYDLLNEAKAYNHLKRIGCVNIQFIPASAKGEKTPDLGADAQGRKVLCEVRQSIPRMLRLIAQTQAGLARRSSNWTLAFSEN